jgi:hypothetical protein
MSETSSSSSSIGFFGLLTVLFIGLKLTGYIYWSWWWVLSPLWLPFTVGIILFLAALLVFALAKVIANKLAPIFRGDNE